MGKLKHNISLSRMVDDFSSELADFARWPEVPARQLSIEQDMKVLVDAFRGFDPVISNALFLLLISTLINDVQMREIPRSGIRAALLKLADVIDPPKGDKK